MRTNKIVTTNLQVTVTMRKKQHLEVSECTARLRAVGDALYAIGGKWKLRIIVALSDGSKRFNELQRTVTGISARVLSNELKELELNGFVQRTMHEGPPLIVEYELTEYSDTLDEVVGALMDWGMRHKAKIKSGK